MTGAEILNDLGIRGYERPLSDVRNLPTWPSLTSPLQVTLLVIDFDTEVAMNGILGFLENSTGAYLNQTIDVFVMLGSTQTAEVLQGIRAIMSKHAVTHEQLRAPYQNVSEYQITSFKELHGPLFDDFAAEVCAHAEELYIHDQTKESPFPLLTAYVDKHVTEILAELERVGVKP